MIYTIGQLSKKTQCKIPTIRYYEEIGLLDKALRSAGNQRQYTSSQCQRLHFIRHSRALGFSLDEIRDLLNLNECHQADKVAMKHLADVRNKIKKLQHLEQELLMMINDCQNSISEDCLVLKKLNSIAIEDDADL
ncbi:helix-turn-helix domain-containing protein [Psychromonas sp. SR45-3]|uniref:MerR family transcriptional regulator n=1 Tax=Psychromonas sp. SR45-3 TaxID=2760930 RepID=UPI0015FD3E07|nr:helix-turn-helix domain-containing protein [Psychromonas sp. SR45-3]MBB1272000.1 helix-turn-helix domain-containing protein [Psychromonas sp. SR45-3]